MKIHSMMTLRTWLRIFFFGKKVGEDVYGNHFYKSRANQRWAVYKKNHTEISAEWFAWLHHSVKETPLVIKSFPSIFISIQKQEKCYKPWQPK